MARHNVVAAELLSALERLGAEVRRKARRRKIGETVTLPDRRPYQSSSQAVQASLQAMKRRFPDEEYYVLAEHASYRSAEDELTHFLELFMRDAKSTAAAVQLKLDL